MDSAGTASLTKYPFLRRAREYVSSLGMSFDDILNHPIYKAALDLGRERVVECYERRYKPKPGEGIPELMILSYPFARMLAHTAGPNVSGKYAEGEAEAAYRLLSHEKPPVIAEVAADLGLKVEGGMMPSIQYLQLASALGRGNPKWKLTNRVVDRGLVEVKDDETLLLLKSAIRNRILEPVDTKKMPAEIRKVAADLKAAIVGAAPTIRVEQLEMEAMPPCMKAMLTALEAGLASHNSMFILATFLANLGLKKDEISAIYSRSPKYDPEKTNYQLEFITGEKGATEYTCPTCATIKTHGLCKAECPVKHPLQYYRQHAKRKPKVIKKKV